MEVFIVAASKRKVRTGVPDEVVKTSAEVKFGFSEVSSLTEKVREATE